jgi:DNA repair protein RecO (recombination protein O)
MLSKDLAICIRAIDYSETSQIVTLFTRANGKISVIAKGSKRPKSAFDGPIEVFAHGEIVFSDPNKEKLATLTEFQQQSGFTHLANNIFALNCCLFAVELLSNLTDDYDPHPELFDSFLQFLQNVDEQRTMNNEQRDITALLILFQLTLLKEVGLMPVLDTCVNCKTSIEPATKTAGKHRVSSIEHQVYFSSTANGFICRDCENSFPDKIRLTKNAADCLSNLKLIADVDKKTLNEIEKVLIHHFTELIGKPPKMAKHVARGS